MQQIRTYDEISRISTFVDRFRYLKIGGEVGQVSFGFDRYLNQSLYRSKEWRAIRDRAIIRDDGCDLGMPGYSIGSRIIVHHINPISVDDLENGNPDIYDLRYLICVSPNTHNAIHFGDENLLDKDLVKRLPGDTCPWKIKG